MPAYNRSFELSIQDIALIDTALRERAAKIATDVIEAKTGHDIPDLSHIAEMESELRRGEELLGHLHSQKVFYRPKSDIYVSG